jgi:hypothetical protein
MPLKASDRGDAPSFQAFDGGFSWIAHPEEGMQRASHALATDAGVWLVDPVDAEGLDERIAEYGAVAGVLLLLDRHERDTAVLARRHDVPVSMPEGVDRDVDAPVRRVTGSLPDTDYRFLTVLDWPGWHEVALFDGETLVVPESLGTAGFFRAGGERLGFNPVARLSPPRQLADLEPERLLVGHGPSVLEDATGALRTALASGRRNLPRAWLGALRSML